MPEQRKVQCCDCVDRPYASVRDALHRLPLADVATASVHVHSVCDQEHVAGLPSLTRVALGCESEEAFAPLPLTSAEIYASARSASETQLEIEGHMVPASGAWSDTEGDRVAAVCLRALLEKVIDRLRRDIDSKSEASPTTWTRNGSLDAA